LRGAAILVPAVLLASCGSSDQSGPGGVTTAESKALDDAAEMVEQQRLPHEALRPPAATQANPQATGAPVPAK
jgi:hypothetical protein